MYSTSLWRRAARKLGLHRVRDEFRDFCIRRSGLRWNLKSGQVAEIHNFADWVVYSDIFVDGEYDRAIDSCLDGAPKDRLLQVVDLGANVGFFALRFGERLYLRDGGRRFRVTMVEGSPRVAAELRHRVRANPMLAEQTVVLEGLVGERSGTGTIHEAPFHAMSSTAAGSGRSVSSPYVELDAQMADAEQIDLLKCDIEGSELRFLENYPAILAKCRVVVMELHFDYCNVEKCRRILREAGLASKFVVRSTDSIAVEVFGRDAPGGPYRPEA